MGKLRERREKEMKRDDATERKSGRERERNGETMRDGARKFGIGLT